MIKTVLGGSFEFDDQIASVVHRHRAGVDREWLHKRAAAALFNFDDMHPRRGETLVHLLALGDGERYGSNRNGDRFNRAENEGYHHTFMKGAYFHHHNNDSSSKAFGRVVATAHNPAMGRVELVVGLDNDKCAEDLNDLETRGEFPVSMSCFDDPSTPIRTLRGYVPIRDVTTNDFVLTHDGQWSKVTETMSRSYYGLIVSIKVRGISRRIRMTAEHPMFCRRVKSVVSADGEIELNCEYDWQHASHLVRGSRIACVVSGSAMSSGVDEAEAHAIGHSWANNRVIDRHYVEIGSSDTNAQLAFVGALVDTLGRVGGFGFNVALPSEAMTLFVRDICIEAGVTAAAQNRNRTWCVYLPFGGIEPLRKYSTAASKSPLCVLPRWPVAINDSWPSYMITDVELHEVSGVPVYNMEIAGSHSYSAAGLASHNCRVHHDICSICNHQARTRKDYCKHASEMMGQILHDGRIVCVDNPQPDFFDISRVWRGADRTAFTLRRLEKAANEGRTVGGAELAEILQVGSDRSARSVYATQKLQILCDIRKAAGSDAAKRASISTPPVLPADAVKALQSADRSALVMAMHKAAFLLPVESFMRLFELPGNAGGVRSAIRDLIAESSADDRIASNADYDGQDTRIGAKLAADIDMLRCAYGAIPSGSMFDIVVGESTVPSKAASSSLSDCQTAEEYLAYVASFVRAAKIFHPGIENLTAICAVR